MTDRFWSAPVLWRFGKWLGYRKRQRTAAVQDASAKRGPSLKQIEDEEDYNASSSRLISFSRALASFFVRRGNFPPSVMKSPWRVSINLSSSTSMAVTAFSLARIFSSATMQQQFHRRRQRAEAVAQFLLQGFQRGFVRGLRQFAVDFDAMMRLGDVVVGQVSSQ